MFTRRTFLTAAAATSLVPHVASAKTKTAEYDPTPQYVRIKKEFLPGQLLVVPRSFYLYFVTEPRKAIRYGCGVGRAGLEFTGTATIDVKKEWPTWRPTDEMIEREPITYARFKDNDYVQPGGGDNPLGARALYLFQNGIDTYFRIHGTTQPSTIGTAASNGCIRMLNAHVIDLYARVPIGTVVTVI
ncbi:L,D-transpeptidase [Ruegeria lacuscaerulensis]|uniref:L,D-transpeptidase n=1 Tax=Ruegeria lacuscaerulensis TaxID=55218 RepID=UPI00147D3677|nr:L,D-transpeptidase [Ruegeria lacuscaerulensis]